DRRALRGRGPLRDRQRRRGVPRRGSPPRPLRGGHVPARDPPRGGPRRRHRHRAQLDQRPHPRLRRSEQRLLLMSPPANSAPAMPADDGPLVGKNPLAQLDAARTEAREKSEVLIEAMPWMQRFRGRIVVVKYGGNAMVDDELRRGFAADVVFMRLAGIHVVVVHGGGPQINAMLERVGKESTFRGGLRVTDAETMEIA